MTDLLAIIFISLGVITFTIGSLGVFKFKYVLNRIHSASICDTLGTLLIIIGLIFIASDFYHAIKLILVVLFMWLTNPVANNFIARVERMTNIHWKERVEDEK